MFFSSDLLTIQMEVTEKTEKDHWEESLEPVFFLNTPGQINIEPENDGLENVFFSFQGCILRFHVNFPGYHFGTAEFPLSKQN